MVFVTGSDGSRWLDIDSLEDDKKPWMFGDIEVSGENVFLAMDIEYKKQEVINGMDKCEK